MMEGLASEGSVENVVMIDATCLKAHRRALDLTARQRYPVISAGV